MSLNWYHFPDAERSMVDARARIRFLPPKIDGDRWGKHRRMDVVVTIEVGTMPVRHVGDPDRVWAYFNARTGPDHGSGQGLARAEVLLDSTPDDPVDALTHAIGMAEQWTAAWMGPGWSPMLIEDADRAHPPPALWEPQASGGRWRVHFEDDATPIDIVADLDRCGLTWFRFDDPDHPGYVSGTEVIDGHRIDRIERW